MGISIRDRLQYLVDVMESGNASAFAKKANIAPNTLHNYLKGRTPSVESLINIQEEYNINMNWLFTGEGKMFIDEKEPTKDQEPNNQLVQYKSLYREWDGQLAKHPESEPVQEKGIINLDDMQKRIDWVRLAARIGKKETLNAMISLQEYLAMQIGNLRNENDQNTKHQEPTANS